eukprot:PhF_6_TR27863/c0_g2_i1/m.40739
MLCLFHVPLVMLLLLSVEASPQFQKLIPNGGNVPGWPAVGHLVANPGSSTRNQFGKDFDRQGLTWTVTLCNMDSDGDGFTNGVELGDGKCTWKSGDPDPPGPVYHPGFATDSPTVNQNTTTTSAPLTNGPPVTSAPPPPAPTTTKSPIAPTTAPPVPTRTLPPPGTPSPTQAVPSGWPRTTMVLNLSPENFNEALYLSKMKTLSTAKTASLVVVKRTNLLLQKPFQHHSSRFQQPLQGQSVSVEIVTAFTGCAQSEALSYSFQMAAPTGDLVIAFNIQSVNVNDGNGKILSSTNPPSATSEGDQSSSSMPIWGIAVIVVIGGLIFLGLAALMVYRYKAGLMGNNPPRRLPEDSPSKPRENQTTPAVITEPIKSDPPKPSEEGVKKNAVKSASTTVLAVLCDSILCVAADVLDGQPRRTILPQGI